MRRIPSTPESEAPLSNKQARDFLRMFLSGASAEKPDSQNRITVPPALRAYAAFATSAAKGAVRVVP